MLERVAVRHLESGGKCLLRGGRLRTRALHSSFWTHGAADIDLANAATLGLFSGAGEHNVSADDPATPPSLTVDDRPESMALDFLYPTKTLDFLQHLVMAAMPRRTTSTTPFSTMVVGAMRRDYTAARTYVTKAGNSIEIKPVPTVYNVSGEHAIFSLQDLRDSGLTEKYDLAWQLYHKEVVPSNWSKDFLCQYLLPSPNRRETYRLLEFCLSESSKSRTACMDETLCILHLRLGDQKAAWKHLEEVVQKTKNPAFRGFEYYLAHFIEKRDWKEVFRTYALLRSFHGTPFEDTITFPRVFSDMRRSIVPSKIIQINRNLAWVILDWARSLPAPSPTDPFALFIEDIAEDLIKGCLYNFTQWGSQWTPGSEKFWQICHDRNWEVSSSNWQRMMTYLAFNQREDWFIKLYTIYRETQQPEEAQIKVLNDVLDILGHRKNLRAMKMVMDDIFELGKGGEPNRITFNIVMKHFASMGAAPSVEKIWELYEGRYRINRSKDFAHLLQAYSKRGEISQVIRWFNAISEKYGLEPETLCYNILITAYGKAGDLDAAFFRIEEMVGKGITPDIFSYTSLMEAAAIKGDVKTTESLLDIIQRMTAVPNIRWYRILASCYVKAGDLERAREVIRTVLEDVPDQTPTAVYTVVIAGYVNANRFAEADALFLEMAQLGISFNNVTYGVLMHSLCLNSQPDVAEQTLDYMKEVGLEVTATEYSTVIAGYARLGNDTKAIELYKLMLERGIQQNFGSLALLIRLVAQMERRKKRSEHILVLDEAEQVLEDVMINFADFVDFGSHEAVKSAIPPWIFTPIMSIYTKAGSINRSLAIFEKFVDIAVSKRPQGSEPNLAMFELMMAVYQASGQINAVRDLWTSLRRRARRYFETLDDNNNWVVLPQNRLKLCAGLRYIMQTFVIRQEYEQMDKQIERLVSVGYELDNVNWNDYVQAVCQSGDIVKATTICEMNLMQEWATMRPYYVAASADERKSMISARIRLPERRPFVRTLETIAVTLKELSDKRYQGDMEAYRALEALQSVAPCTLEAVEGLANLSERIQKDMMYRMQRQAFRALDYTDSTPPPLERQMGQWDEGESRSKVENASRIVQMEHEYSEQTLPEMPEDEPGMTQEPEFAVKKVKEHFDSQWKEVVETGAALRAELAVPRQRGAEKFKAKPAAPLGTRVTERMVPPTGDGYQYQDNWTGHPTKARVVGRVPEAGEEPLIPKKAKVKAKAMSRTTSTVPGTKDTPSRTSPSLPMVPTGAMGHDQEKEHLPADDVNEVDAEYERMLREQEAELFREMEAEKQK